MTQQLQSALDALNACQSPDDVADLLRRNGIHGYRCDCYTCPLSIYLRLVGGLEGAEVTSGGNVFGCESKLLPLPTVCRDFIRNYDWNDCYQDLWGTPGQVAVEHDRGQRARAALAGVGGTGATAGAE